MKKLFITLLCVIMVAVFMPTMAFAAAPDFTKDVTLTENTSVAGTVTIDKDITVDLGGYELTYTGDSGSYLFDVVGGATLTIKNGKIITTAGRGVKVTDGSVVLEAVEYNGPERALGIYGGSAEVDLETYLTVTGTDPVIFIRTLDASKPSTLDFSGSAEQTANENGSFAISGNGTDETGKTVINLYDGSFVSSFSAPAIYHPHNGKMTVEGVVIGLTGIEIRAGEVTIEPTAFIVATGETYEAEANGNGSTSTGAAIAVNQHTTKQPIKVTVNGGNMLGAACVVADGVQNDVTENVTVNVHDGLFEGPVKAVKDGGEIVLDGGAFSEIDRETVTVAADDSAIVKDGDIVVEVLGSDPINNFIAQMYEGMEPEDLASVTVEITKASADSKFVVPAGITVKNATGDEITVNDAAVDAGEEITVEEPKEDPQTPDENDPKDEPMDPISTGNPPTDKNDVKKPAGNVSKTGDETTVLPWIALMILAVGGAAALKKKEN